MDKTQTRTLEIFLAIGVFMIIELLAVAAEDSYNVTITPPSYDFKYTGNTRALSFKVCHDNNKSTTIPLAAEIAANNFTNLNKVRMKLLGTNVTTSKCDSISISLSADTGYVPEDISIKLKVFPNKASANATPMATPTPVLNITATNITNASVNITANATAVTENNLTNQTADATPTKNKTTQIVAVIIGLAIIAGLVIYYMYKNSGEETPNGGSE